MDIFVLVFISGTHKHMLNEIPALEHTINKTEKCKPVTDIYIVQGSLNFLLFYISIPSLGCSIKYQPLGWAQPGARKAGSLAEGPRAPDHPRGT